MDTLPNPYDLLGNPDGETKDVILRLFTLAGQVGGLANGYLYEKSALGVLGRFRETQASTNPVQYRKVHDIYEALHENLIYRGRKAAEEYAGLIDI